MTFHCCSFVFSLIFNVDLHVWVIVRLHRICKDRSWSFFTCALAPAYTKSNSHGKSLAQKREYLRALYYDKCQPLSIELRRESSLYVEQKKRSLDILERAILRSSRLIVFPSASKDCEHIYLAESRGTDTIKGLLTPGIVYDLMLLMTTTTVNEATNICLWDEWLPVPVELVKVLNCGNMHDIVCMIADQLRWWK
jgi:hypothetical protein